MIHYFFLHCWHNMFAEILRFADRSFYKVITRSGGGCKKDTGSLDFIPHGYTWMVHWPLREEQFEKLPKEFWDVMALKEKQILTCWNNYTEETDIEVSNYL